MRKLMTKEVTVSTIKMARMDIIDGKPVAIELEPVTVLGRITKEKAQREINKKDQIILKYPFPVTVYEVSTETDVYEMEVEDFIKQAKKRERKEVK